MRLPQRASAVVPFAAGPFHHSTSGRRWRLFLLASAAVVAVYPWLPPVVAAPVALGILAVSALAVFAGARDTGAARLPLHLIGASTASIALMGAGFLGHHLLTGQELAYSSVAQTAAIPSYVLLLAGLVVLRRRQHARGELHGLALDSLLVTIAAGFAVWFVVVQPGIGGDPTPGRLTAAMIGVLLDLPAAYLVLRIMLASSARNPAGRWLALAVLLLLPADALFAIQGSIGTVPVNSPIVASWLATFALLGVAALHPSAAELARPVARRTNPVLWSLTVWASLAAIVVAGAVANMVGAPINWPVRTAVVLVVLAILALRVTMLLRDLDATNTELEAANARKDELLAAVAHDLRSPLTVVLGVAETLREHAPRLTDAEVSDLASRVAAQAHRLDGYVGDLLLVSRLDLGRLLPDRELVRVADVIHRVVAEHGGDTVVAVRADVWVDADREHLVRIVTNLLDNAYKYGRPPVAIDLMRAGDAAVLAVEDSGPGVPEAFVPSLFHRFVRAEETAHLPGSGLGLSIVRSLVTANGGDVHYDARGRGARFVVRLPLVDSDGPAAGGNGSLPADAQVSRPSPEHGDDPIPSQRDDPVATRQV